MQLAPESLGRPIPAIPIRSVTIDDRMKSLVGCAVRSVVQPDGLDDRKLDPVVLAHDLARQVGRQRRLAARANLGMVIDRDLRILGQDAAVTLVAGLGASGTRPLAALLAIRRRRLRRRP